MYIYIYTILYTYIYMYMYMYIYIFFCCLNLALQRTNHFAIYMSLTFAGRPAARRFPSGVGMADRARPGGNVQPTLSIDALDNIILDIL